LNFWQTDGSNSVRAEFWIDKNIRLFFILAASGCFHSRQTDG
jgi:hypothetical protein